MDPIGYTYEADTHCVACARARFGADANGFPPETARDSEGNEPHPIAPWDETPCRGEWCGTCGGNIAEAHHFCKVACDD